MVVLLKTRDLVDDFLDLVFHCFEEKVFFFTFFFGTFYNIFEYSCNLPMSSNLFYSSPTLSVFFDINKNMIMNIFTAPFTIAHAVRVIILFTCPWLPFTGSQFTTLFTPMLYIICAIGACKWYLKYSFRLY
jgi:hypothetical protein